MAVARFHQVGTTFLQANVTHGVRHHLVRGGRIKCGRPGEFARTKPDNHIRMDSDGTFETAPTGTMTTPTVPTIEATEPKPKDAPKKDKKKRAKEAEPEVSAAESAPAAPPPKKKARKKKDDTAVVDAKPAAQDDGAPEAVPEEKTEPKKADKKADKKKAPRRKSAFDLFRASFYETNRGNGVEFQEMNKLCCAEWKELGEASKAEWEAKRAELYPPSDKPKKPPTAWMRFMTDFRAKLNAAGEKVSVPEATKRASEAWKALDAEAKASWKLEAA